MGQDIGLKLEPELAEPLYRQIFDQVVARIVSGAFPPGFRLPPTRSLALALSTHRNTVARAYADLEAAGFVSSEVGRGTFVRPQALSTDGGEEPVQSAMPWSLLLSEGARGDALSRAERFVRRPPSRDVINLARLQPSEDLIPAELMGRCIERVLSDLGARAMSYAPPEGVPRLREEIAQELCARGVPASADDVLVTSGSQQALDLIARALFNPGDAVLVDPTTYSGAIDLFALAGARLTPVPSDAHGPSPAELAALARPNVKALYLMPNGHNPTGLTLPADRRRELCAWSRSAGIPLIEDDYSAGLKLDAEPAPPYLRALDADVLHVSTFSKRLIPALRVGFVVCPPALRGVLASMKRIVDLGTSAVMQHALAEFMERGYLRAHMNRILPEYRARRDALEEALSRHLPAEVRWQRPSHGVVLWLRLPSDVDPDTAYAKALEHGVLVSPSTMWAPESGTQPGLRLVFCAESKERLAEGAKRLGRALTLVVSGKETQRRAPLRELV